MNDDHAPILAEASAAAEHWAAVMRVVRIASTGWVEGAVGLIWLVASVYGWRTGVVPTSALLVDALTFLCLLVALRSVRWGVPLVIAVMVLGLFADPGDLGMADYIALCLVVLLVRKGRLRLAGLVSVLLASLFAVTWLRRAGAHQAAGVFLSLVIFFGVAWVVGLGIRGIANLEAARVAQTFRERQWAVATEIHDLVSRNLTTLAMQLDLASTRGGASAEQLDDFAERTRLASSSLRELTSELWGTWGREAHRVGLQQALKEGVRELSAVGMEVRVQLDPPGGLDELQEETDVVAGSVLAEALHNVWKYADRREPCVVQMEVSQGCLDIAVTNAVGSAGAKTTSTLGLVSMRQQVGLVGGQFDAAELGGTWVCTVSLPLPEVGVGQ